MDANRRQFLKTGAAVAAASYERILGANDRIRLAALGAGGRCQYLLGLALNAGGTELAAVCDVYGPRREEARKKFAPAAVEYVEYREALDRQDIDAVIIGSPDHWHVPMTIDAVRAGKDVYVEKPISHTIEEGERLIDEVRTSKRIVQIGYQQRSWEHFKQAREVVAGGKLGKVSMVLVSWYQNYVQSMQANPAVEAGKLDWKRFLGSAPEQPFDPLRFTRWRWFWDFGGGHLTDLHSHFGDVVHWYMDVDRPLFAEGMGQSVAIPRFECPDTVSASWIYPGGLMVAYNGTLNGSLDGGNMIFRGSHALMKLNRDGFAVYPEGIVPSEKTNYPEPETNIRSAADGTVDHMRNFLECVRNRQTPNAPVTLCTAAARAAHLANLALRKGIRVGG